MSLDNQHGRCFLSQCVSVLKFFCEYMHVGKAEAFRKRFELTLLKLPNPCPFVQLMHKKIQSMEMHLINYAFKPCKLICHSLEIHVL
jgi:hypothetical protein